MRRGLHRLAGQAQGDDIVSAFHARERIDGPENERMSRTPTPARRRRFLTGASAGAIATWAAALFGCAPKEEPPQVPRAAPASTEPLHLRLQSAWPAHDLFHEYAEDFARKVNEMAGGRLKLEMLPAGSVVPAFQLLDSVAKGTLDGAHGTVAYHYGRSPALALWGSGPAYGMDANMLLAWHRYGGGQALLEEIYRTLDLDVVSYLYGPMPTQPLGWFKHPVTRAEDLRGLKFRTVGFAVDVFAEMGVAVKPLPPGEIVPAIQRGLIDAAEFNNASSDRMLGFPDAAKHCMLQSFHQSAEQFEVLFNRTRYEQLPPELRSIIRYAAQAASAEMSWKAIERNSTDYEEMRKAGVQFHKTPDAVLRAQLAAFDRTIEKKAAQDPLVEKVLQSQLAFAARAGRWQYDYAVDRKMAYDHYFSRDPGKS